jgi:hypothetical protein
MTERVDLGMFGVEAEQLDTLRTHVADSLAHLLLELLGETRLWVECGDAEG